MRGPRPAYPRELTAEEVEQLHQLVRAHTSPQAQAVRARIILQTYERPESSNQQIAAQVGTSDRQMRKRWMPTHTLADAPRSGSGALVASQRVLAGSDRNLVQRARAANSCSLITFPARMPSKPLSASISPITIERPSRSTGPIPSRSLNRKSVRIYDSVYLVPPIERPLQSNNPTDQLDLHGQEAQKETWKAFMIACTKSDISFSCIKPGVGL